MKLSEYFRLREEGFEPTHPVKDAVTALRDYAKEEVLAFVANDESACVYLNGMAPSFIDGILSYLGYEQSYFDTNGWDWDFHVIYKKQNCKSISLGGGGWNGSVYLEYYKDDTNYQEDN